MKNDLNLKLIRQKLHKNAELSNKESNTSKLIEDYVKQFQPTNIFRIGYGIVAIWDSFQSGKTVVFRADIDAVPVNEINELSYSSQNTNVSHACGHDGHMTILIGLAEKISINKPHKGKVVLLFQPAEETGEGALKVVANPNFRKLKPDFIFGLHNIPGFKKNAVLIKKDSFACASRGMVVKLFGKTSHAAEPENGVNPVFAIQKLIDKLYSIIEDKNKFQDFVSLTIIHLKLGEAAFGTSPGYAELMATLRSETNSDMNNLIIECEKIIDSVSKEEALKYKISYVDVFPATINDNECVNLVQDVAREMNLKNKMLSKPFKWSEDFANYTNNYKGVLFGIGAGINQPNLHNPDYDFPDEILETGVDLFFAIYKKIFMNENTS